jgi:DedD protein
MEIPLKQRLIGAAVLIALGVIFIPMLLDGAGHREQITLDMEIPPEPQFSFKTPPSASSQDPMGRPPVIESPPQETPPPALQGSAPEVSAAGFPEPAAKPAPATPKPAPVAPLAPKPPPKKLAKAAPQPPTASGWVVQVGSFRKRDNAIALRDKLRAQGYRTFTEQAGSAARPVYRVKVGPIPKRARAEALRNRLAARERLKGLVRSYDPKGGDRS